MARFIAKGGGGDLAVPVVDELPAASAGESGRMYSLRIENGTKTRTYICVQNTADTWEWVQLSVST